MAHDVFISYSSEDKPSADAVCYALENKGIRCWIAPRDVPVGKKWAESIFNAINESRIMILVLSSFSNNSVQVENEVLTAVNKGIAVIPFRIEDVFPSGSLKLHLAGVHWLDALTPPLEKHLKKLAEQVVAFINVQRRPDTSTQKEAEPGIPNQSKLRGKIISHRKIIIFISIILLTSGVGIILFQDWIVPSNKEITKRRDAFFGAMPWLNWIIYDPTEYDPYRNIMPSKTSIRKDLDILRKYGFNGLITITTKGTCSHIAQIAREVGFNMIIVGVWDLRDSEEVDNALSVKEYADAYCLGHKGLIKLYTMQELVQVMNMFRNKANRPVTTSEVLADYEMNPQLNEIGDFLFPDVHSDWHSGQTPRSAWEQTISMARRSAQLGAQYKRPVLLKMISYPSGGEDGLSPETQMKFYRLAVEGSRERTDIPGSAILSFLTAFDPEWKTEDHGWRPPERHTGLFTTDRKPKIAVTQVNWREKHQ